MSENKQPAVAPVQNRNTSKPGFMGKFINYVVEDRTMLNKATQQREPFVAALANIMLASGHVVPVRLSTRENGVPIKNASEFKGQLKGGENVYVEIYSYAEEKGVVRCSANSVLAL